MTAAGSMLLLLAALPGHSQGHARLVQPPRTSCDAGARGEEACDEKKNATTRRHAPRTGIQRECARIDAAIRDNEQAEQRSGARGVMEALQHDLLILRKRYRELNC